MHPDPRRILPVVGILVILGLAGYYLVWPAFSKNGELVVSGTVEATEVRLASELGGLVDEVRREQAMRYVRDSSLSLTEVAFLLGYSDQSAFNHAFRKWFDAAPSAWRRENGDQAGRERVGAPPVPRVRAAALDF